MRMSYLLGVMESGSPGVLEPKSMESFFPAPNLAARAGYEGWVTPIISSWDCLMGRILDDGSEYWWNDGYHPCDHPNFWWDVRPNDLVLHIPPCSCLPHVQIPYAWGRTHESGIYWFLIYPYIYIHNYTYNILMFYTLKFSELPSYHPVF